MRERFDWITWNLESMLLEPTFSWLALAGGFILGSSWINPENGNLGWHHGHGSYVAATVLILYSIVSLAYAARSDYTGSTPCLDLHLLVPALVVPTIALYAHDSRLHATELYLALSGISLGAFVVMSWLHWEEAPPTKLTHKKVWVTPPIRIMRLTFLAAPASSLAVITIYGYSMWFWAVLTGSCMIVLHLVSFSAVDRPLTYNDIMRRKTFRKKSSPYAAMSGQP